LETTFHFPDDDRSDDYGSDSLDLVEIVMAYEEAFGEEILDGEMEKMKAFRTKEELIEYLRKRKKGGGLS
jgi:acyl carrier protein